jgi:hypothetical protein
VSDKLLVTLSSNKIEIIPGKKTELKAIIKNTSDVTESYSIAVDGVDPRWYTLSPASVSLSPGDTSELTLAIKPPLISSGEAERYTANLRVTSTRDSSIKTTVPIEMPVGSLLDFDLQLTPEKQKGRKGSFAVSITNKGDGPTTYAIEGKDPYNACRFQFKQQTVDIQPGETAKVSLVVKPKDRPFRGSVEAYKFKVVVTPHGSLPYQSKGVSGELTYKPILRTIPAFLLVVAVIIVASSINGLSSMFSNLVEGGPPISYTLTMNMDGYGTISGYGTYDEGSVASIRASADSKWEFVEWTGDIDTVGNRLSSRTSVVMDRDYTITANFGLREITPHTVYNIVLDPQWPAILYFDEWIKINFEYTIEFNFYSEGEFDIDIVPDAHILARPFTNGALSPGYLVRGYNFLRPWDKEGECEFTINPQPDQVVVDQIRFQITNADKTIIFHEFFVPVIYTFQQDESMEEEE